jgi:hypothetical protein
VKNRNRNGMRHIMTWSGRAIACIIFGLCLSGCLLKRSPDIHVAAVNAGTVYLKDVVVYFGDWASNVGVLSAGSTAIHSFFGGPLTPEARVVFRQNEGPPLERIVSVPALSGMGGKWGYTLTFIIDSDHGTVKLETCEEGK